MAKKRPMVKYPTYKIRWRQTFAACPRKFTQSIKQPKVAFRLFNGFSAFDPAVRVALILPRQVDGQKYLLELN